MDFREWKLEITIVAGAVILLLAMLSLFKSFTPNSALETKEIVYEMPRPVSPELESDFDLANREITREYINSQLKNGKSNKPIAAIPKKEAAKAVQKKDDKKSAQAKKPELKINVIPANPLPRFASNDGSANTSRALTNTQANNKAPKEDAKNKEDDKKTMTIEEWRQILMAQPTLANMNKFLTAYRNKDVSVEDYTHLSQELLAGDKEHQAAGLYALQSAPSATSFAVITKSVSKLTIENQATAHQILLSYSQPQRLAYLSQALQSDDAEVVKQAADTITYGLAQVKKGQVVQDSRNTRGDVSTASTLQSYSRRPRSR